MRIQVRDYYFIFQVRGNGILDKANDRSDEDKQMYLRDIQDIKSKRIGDALDIEMATERALSRMTPRFFALEIELIIILLTEMKNQNWDKTMKFGFEYVELTFSTPIREVSSRFFEHTSLEPHREVQSGLLHALTPSRTKHRTRRGESPSGTFRRLNI